MDNFHNYRIWIDTSHTFDSGLYTGIQRVVRNLATNVPPVANEAGIPCSTVLLRENAFHDLENYQRRWGTTSFRTWKRSTRYRRMNYIPAKVYFSIRQLFQLAYRSKTSIRMQALDWLILPDGYWAMDGIWRHVRQARNDGVRVCAVLYDLIPVLNPDFFPPRSQTRFVAYLDRMMSDVDLVMCISKTVEQDYRRYVDQRRTTQGITHKQTIASFRLGADLLNCSAEDSLLQPRSESLLPKDDVPFFLQVGTIEPRKNHSMVMDAMERLWLRGVNVRCVFVGRSGWMEDELLLRIAAHSEYNSRLFHFASLDDFALTDLYRKCHAVLCPSLAEGFGLPIVEGLFLGKRVIASDIPIHREVGQDACLYFDVHNLAALVQLMEQSLLPSSGMHETEIARAASWCREAISWRNSAAELLTHIIC